MFPQSGSEPARGGRGGWPAAEKLAGWAEGELRQLQLLQASTGPLVAYQGRAPQPEAPPPEPACCSFIG